jgi:hypothetical protein
LSGIFVTVSATVGAVVWFLSGLLIFAVGWRSSTWEPAAALVLPPTVPLGTWQQLSPWNLVLPALGALLFGGLAGVALFGLSRWRSWRSASSGIRFLTAWIAAVVVAFVTAAVWALGETIANSSPLGFAEAFRFTLPDLLGSGYFGVVWGWLPALTLMLFATRARFARPPRSWSVWVVAAVAVLSVAAAVGVVIAQPAAARAGRTACSHPCADTETRRTARPGRTRPGAARGGLVRSRKHQPDSVGNAGRAGPSRPHPGSGQSVTDGVRRQRLPGYRVRRQWRQCLESERSPRIVIHGDRPRSNHHHRGRWNVC